jgi:ATP-binding cassette subfamily F protein 3
MLSITDISIRIAGRLLIDESTVQIAPGARVGFVGRNGVGKSTLFHAIRGDLATETGSISIPPRWRIGSLAQEAPDGPESLISVVLESRSRARRTAEGSRDRLRSGAHFRHPDPPCRYRRAFRARSRRSDSERPWLFG